MTLKIIQWNTRNFNSNKPSINYVTDKLSPHILCIQETWARPTTQTLKLPGFNQISRKDRSDGRGGGVAIFANPATPTIPLILDSPLEVCGIKVLSATHPFSIISLYLPPSQIENLEDKLNSLINIIPTPFIICTDGNGHHQQWGSPQDNPRGIQLEKWISSNNLQLLNTGEPTFETPQVNYTHIDLSICSPSFASSLEWDVYHENLQSDHFPIEIKFPEIQITPLKNIPKFKTNKANWEKFQETLTLPAPPFTTPSKTCQLMEESLLSAAKLSIPQTPLEFKPKFNKYWWTPECSTALENQKKALKTYKNNLGNIDLWIQYKKCKAKFKYSIRKAKKESWAEFVGTLNKDTPSTVVWNKIKMLRNKKTQKNIILKDSDSDSYISDPLQISNKLAKDFSNRGNSTNEIPPHPVDNQTFSKSNLPHYNSNISSAELNRALTMGSSSTPGPDQLPPEIYRHLTEFQKLNLLTILNYFWNNGLPKQWKNAIVIPIPKPNKIQTESSSFRPIALTNSICKIFERIVTLRLKHFLETNKIITAFQSGFRSGFSTIDSLSRFENSIRTNTLKGSATLAVFLDITQAFDSVDHPSLLKKIENTGLRGNLASFIKDFISDRTISVRYQTTYSDSYSTPLGVPQGSVISPILFIMMINDMLTDSNNLASYSLYADDVAIWYSDSNLDNCFNQIQNTLDILERWAKEWGFRFSAAKSKAMFFTKKKLPDRTLTLDSDPIQLVTSFKFLGLNFDKNLTWKNHITQIKDRCTSDLNLLKTVAAQKWGADFSTLRQLYISLTLSKISYASFLYDNASKSNLIILDRLQYAAARTILGCLKCTKVHDLELLTNLMPLTLHRKMQLINYTCSVLSVQGNPLRNIILDYYPFPHYSFFNFPLPICGRILDEFKKLNLDLKNIGSSPPSSKYLTNDNLAQNNLHICPKEQLTPAQWRCQFNSMLKNYPHHNTIYTDGSVCGSKGGCGVWSSSFSLKARLPDNSSIFTCELYAIYVAILYSFKSPQPILILTDSLSATISLKNPHKSKHYLIEKISSKILTLPHKKITIEWIPSHTGIPGNDNADKLAKESLDLTYITQSPYSSRDAHKIAYKYFAQKATNTWLTMNQNALQPISLKPEHLPFPFLLTPRRTQVALTRLHLRVTWLTHQHYFTKKPPISCHHCNVFNSIHHIFMVCPNFDTARQALIKQCHASKFSPNLNDILDGKFPIDIIINFLKACNTLNKL